MKHRLLNSLIYSVEVNPIWNIPRSIANKEIIVEAARDPYYLSNRGIDVYEDDKLVENPEKIDWTTITKENLPYDFRQILEKIILLAKLNSFLRIKVTFTCTIPRQNGRFIKA